MTSPTRRRLTIAVILLAVLVATAWLLTTRIDRRLVGEWVNVDPARFAAWRQFHADGTHRYSADPLNPLLGGGGSWSAWGNRLTFRQNTYAITAGGSLRRLWYELVNRFRAGRGVEHYAILEVTPETLRIQSDSGAPVEEYRRKPSP
jgi:hypothetical protein